MFNSGHLIASLSSKSAKRFLVNFQIKNEMMAMTATPPATERPIIEPVPRPPELLLLAEEDSVLDALGVGVGVMTIVLVNSCPAELVETETVVDGRRTVVGVVAAVVSGGGVELVCVGVVVVGLDVGVLVVVWVGEVVGGVEVVKGVDVVCGVVVVGVVVGGVVVGVVVVGPTGGTDTVSSRA